MPRMLFARRRGAALAADAAGFAAGQAQGTALATLSDPFAGLGLGTTSYATFGTVPGQLALSGATIVMGASAAVAGTGYAIGVIATSGDGRRRVGETITLTATASAQAGGGGTTSWMIAASRGEIAYGTGGVSNANAERIQSRSRHVLGKASYTGLKVVDVGYYVAPTNVETALANARTISRAIEIPGAPTPVVRLRWSGAASTSVAGGATWVESDPVLPADFGLASFAAGTVFWLRSIEDTPTGAARLQGMTIGTGSPAGEGAVVSAIATGDQLMGQGALATGTGITGYGQLLMPLAILGQSAAHGVSVVSVGDSIAFGQGETTLGAGDGSSSGGFVRRALYANGLPFASAARAQTTAQQFVGNCAGRTLLFARASHALVEYGTNDINSGRTSAQCLADVQSIYALLRQAGVRRIEQTTLLPRVGGSSLTVPSGQTPVARFADADAGGRRDFNLAIAGGTGGAGPDAIVDVSAAAQDAGLPDRWGVDAGPVARTVDGVHPSAAGHAAMATPLSQRVAGWS